MPGEKPTSAGLYDEFHLAVRSVGEPAKMMDALEKMLNRHGVDGYVWFSAKDDDWRATRFENSTILSRGPLRLKMFEILYMWKGHHRDDPVVAEVQKRLRPFTSLEVYQKPLTRKQQALVALTRKFGYVYDYIVPTHLPGRVEGMVFFFLGQDQQRLSTFKGLYRDLERIALHCSILLRMDTEQQYSRSMVDLTTREHECLALVARGFSNREISTELNITERTVKYHVSNLLQKFDVKGRSQLIVAAAKQNMLTN